MFSIERVLCSVGALLLVFSLSSCRSRDPNPELKDPIFKDLTTLHKDYEKKLKEELKTQEENKKELELAGANGMDLKVARKKIASTAKKITHYGQMTNYFRIRAERRKVEGRRAYSIAFEKGEDWPNPTEYQMYLVNKRLREAPRSWSTRVPKMIDRFVAQKPEK